MFGLNLNTKDRDFRDKFNSFLHNKNFLNNSTKDDVYKIIESVRNEGDQAVIGATNKYDNRKVLSIN